ncbi:hypothetical protein HBH70_098940 [Parastagonospora nodorum]|nr:hypothetical protein HBH43_091840 [Parastagonospora nodorum]KAH4605070.1 hypothetical protein HBH82_126070 [Parastagonospora nodorum]KAH4688492.1 hypothetical protein HBH78_102780 [Parastagonospora nodorum]KAH4707026.1 hypothetical protein HBH67_080760 [Parastagonospora nodorum]KAH4779242.1 hypothetical protein HBH62_144180 [Parastagonospora nodorum]
MLSLWSRTGLNHSHFWIEADPSTQGYMEPLVYLDVGLALHIFAEFPMACANYRDFAALVLKTPTPRTNQSPPIRPTRTLGAIIPHTA